MNAKSRQANGCRSRATTEIQCAQRLFGLLGKKIVQVGEGQVRAQPSPGRFEVVSVFARAALEAFAAGTGGHIHAISKRNRPNCRFDTSPMPSKLIMKLTAPLPNRRQRLVLGQVRFSIDFNPDLIRQSSVTKTSSDHLDRSLGNTQESGALAA
jgi:hypothetical protein